LKAEGVPRRLDEDVKANDTLVSPKKPTPDRSERLNGMEERDEEDNEFWKKEEREQKKQNEEQKEQKRIEEEEEEEPNDE
jgi:hypothetical protein